MSRHRGDVLERIEALVPRVQEHLEKIARNPADSAVPHWKGEARGWLNKMEALVRHVGKKTAREWQARIDAWSAAIED